MIPKRRYKAYLTLIDQSSANPKDTETVSIGHGETEQEARFNVSCADDLIRELTAERDKLKEDFEAALVEIGFLAEIIGGR